MDKKRILFAIVFFIITIILGVLLWMVFFSPKKPFSNPIGPNSPTAPDAFPQAGEGGDRGSVVTPPGSLPSSQPSQPGSSQPGTTIPSSGALPRLPASTKILDIPVLAISKDTTGIARFYNQQDGKFYRLLPDGTLQALSDKTFFNVDQVIWSPGKNESIIEYPDGSNIFFNFENQSQVTLPKHWEEFSFSPQSDKIVAKSLGYSPENRWLITSDPEGNTITALEPLGENSDKVIVDWSPNKQILAMSLTGDAIDGNRQEVLFVGQNKENFQSTIVEGRGFIPQWSPSGSKLLYSVYNNQNDFNPGLWIVNASGDEIGTGRKFLDVDTWASKCTFGNDDRFVYCGVPNNLPPGAGFQPTLANNLPDTLLKIDVQTGIKTEIPLDTTPTIQSLFVGDDGSSLYYIDANTPGLFSVPL